MMLRISGAAGDRQCEILGRDARMPIGIQACAKYARWRYYDGLFGRSRWGSDSLHNRRGQGHIWPGGKNFLPELIVGKATDTLNATDAIWKFFMSHARTRPDKP